MMERDCAVKDCLHTCPCRLQTSRHYMTLLTCLQYINVLTVTYSQKTRPALAMHCCT